MNAPSTSVATAGYRTVLTGATGGLGEQMALQLALHSTHLLLLGRNQDALATLVAQLSTQAPACKVQVQAGDLLDPAYLSKVVQVASTLGGAGANLLINNAGINQFGPAHSLSSAQTHNILDTNLLAPMLLTQALLNTLRAQNQAQVIQVGSILGYIGYPGNAAYCASKSGLLGYTQALRRELSHTAVQVKYFAPRATKTPINTAEVDRLNQALGTKTDAPQWVAQQLIQCIQAQKAEWRLGFPERLFVWINRLFPSINDKAIAKQLPVIEQHYPTRNS